LPEGASGRATVAGGKRAHGCSAEAHAQARSRRSGRALGAQWRGSAAASLVLLLRRRSWRASGARGAGGARRRMSVGDHSCRRRERHIHGEGIKCFELLWRIKLRGNLHFRMQK
jgi:hypothetical protein